MRNGTQLKKNYLYLYFLKIYFEICIIYLYVQLFLCIIYVPQIICSDSSFAKSECEGWWFESTNRYCVNWMACKRSPPPISSQSQYSAYKTECGFRPQSGNAYVQALELP